MSIFERDAVVSTMSAQVTRLIGIRIVSGEFEPGATLPIESEFCQAYGVSRSTIREAVKNLSAKRLVEVAPKIGTRVLPFSEWNLLDQDVLSWRLNAQFDERIVEDLYEMRQCFEPRACELAAIHGSADGHARIQQRYADLVSLLDQPALAAGAETEFHLSIIAATKNGLFVTIGGAVKTALKVSFAMTQRGAKEQPIDLHLYEMVVTAILDRKGPQAAEAMRALLNFSRLRVLAALPKTRPGRQAT